VSLAHGHGLRGIEAAARALLAQALADAGDPAAARQQIEQALQLRDQGHVVDQMPGAEIDLIAIQLLQHSDPPQAAALLARATAWLQHTAQTEVPEAFRHGFLHLQPVHRQLLALKSPAAVAGTPLQGQSGACSANAPSSS
jgi:ATP/maltotriose-dependent transcriptional regulator MalT